MHVLITGSSGFIGRQVSSALTESGNTITRASREDGTDITNWDNVKGLGPADVVIHLAGVMGGDGSPRETYTVNCLGTLHLLEYSRLNKVRCMVFSSSYVYGSACYLSVDEAHPLLGKGAYTRSKILAEELCRAYAAAYDLPVVALRVFNAYGPGQQGNMLIPTILSQLTTTGEVVLRDPAPRRDFVYVDDVVEAFLAAARDPVPGFRAYNVASGRSVSVVEVLREIEKAWGSSFPVRYTGERRIDEIMDSAGSNLLIAEELGWAPKVSFQEGIRRTVAWWR